MVAFGATADGVALIDWQERLLVCDSGFLAYYGEGQGGPAPACVAQLLARASHSPALGLGRQAAGEWRRHRLAEFRSGPDRPFIQDLPGGRAELVLRRTGEGDWVALLTARPVEARAAALPEPPLDELPVAVFLADSGTIRYANHAAGQLFGCPPGRLIDAGLEQFMPAGERPRRLQRVQELVVGERTISAVEQIYLPITGEPFVGRASFTPYRFPDGTPGIQAVVTDVTEIHRTNRIVDMLLDHNPVVLFGVDEHRNFVLSRGSGLARLGLTDHEVEGLNALDLFEEPIRALEAARRANRYFVETHGLTPDGKPWAYYNFIFEDPVADEDRFYCLSVDITDRLEQERRMAELARRNAMLAAAVQETTSGIAISDPHQADNPLIFVNAAFERITGYPAQEVVGRNCRFLQGPGTAAEAVRALHDAIAAQRPARVELCNYRRDGTPFWNEVSISPVFDPEGGGLLYFVGVQQDITERVEAERERTQLAEEFQRAQKMEAVGRLAGGIAHDFNNILATVLGNADMLAEELADPGPAQQIVTAAERGRDMVRRLLAFSRSESGQAYGPVVLAELVREAGELLRPSVPKTAELQVAVNPAAEGREVAGDPVQLEQAILNIVLNAAQALGHDTGTIGLALAPVELDGGRAQGLVSRDPSTVTPILLEGDETHLPVRVFVGILAAGPYLCLSVTDDGPGMDRRTAERLFEPYFTTKVVGEGSGLGLPAVQGIVAAHEGGLVVTARPGAGTRFDIYLPAAPAGA